ncbi:MAG: hypothetical protein O4861_16415 [Trichodesmium sp. St16_bin4-tuft]|nr:hypothetical protein [Trichodesmium sp. MAG_R01]MDE5071693.1 hypothetical protein [Trichodesmium sp. St5_bin8]MDE5077892.1 hypothetical protein [Trichodesmium sp. St2_bin6]MDE5099826.1 hypothetical protein [Trichodesmium sp. St16_bin4-tuft]MDE5105347.1 hypothetical protein [Trichodesmium sp. St19_bin2]
MLNYSRFGVKAKIDVLTYAWTAIPSYSLTCQSLPEVSLQMIAKTLIFFRPASGINAKSLTRCLGCQTNNKVVRISLTKM